MEVHFLPDGIYLPDIDLWLDPVPGKPAAWISHAHSDHARGVHGRVWATPETMGFYLARWPDAASATLSRISYGENFEWHGARCTVLPAGHILGAAQLLVDYAGQRLVYTGDIKLRKPMCGAETAPISCDRLIMECTFGLPVYQFLEAAQAKASIAVAARECLAGGITPVFYGYPLGRGQELVHALAEAGIPTAVHGSIARFIPAYEQAGYCFDGWEPYRPQRMKGKALVLVPGMRNVLEASEKSFRVAYVSGWAALANARARVGADELIPYSDHGGFAELVELATRSGARRVDLVHGYTEPFARVLQARGINAYPAGAVQVRDAGEDSAAE